MCQWVLPGVTVYVGVRLLSKGRGVLCNRWVQRVGGYGNHEHTAKLGCGVAEVLVPGMPGALAPQVVGGYSITKNYFSLRVHFSVLYGAWTVDFETMTMSPP